MARPPTISREEPEDADAPASSHRIDFVDVAPAAHASNAMVSLRRELARLSQQAMVVEKSLETQGRDRKEALERLERSAQYVLTLETRLSASEAEARAVKRLHEATLDELQRTRGERDDLAQVVQAARSASGELAHARTELDRLKATHDEALKKVTALEAELVEVRRRQFKEALAATDRDAEVGKLRDHLVRAEEKEKHAREATERMQAESAKARQELEAARDATTRAREELAQAREELARERSDAQARIERLTRESESAAATHAEQLQALQKTCVEAEDLAAASKNALARAQGETEAMRVDRDAADERSTRFEIELAEVREEETRLREQLDKSREAATAGIARAETAERTHATLVQEMKQLFDQVVAGFERSGITAPKPAATAESKPEEPPPYPPTVVTTS